MTEFVKPHAFGVIIIKIRAFVANLCKTASRKK